MTYLPAHLEPFRQYIRLRLVPTVEEALAIPASLVTCAARRREQAIVNEQLELLERLHTAGEICAESLAPARDIPTGANIEPGE